MSLNQIHLPRSVLFISGRPLGNSCVRYRCFHAQEQLRLAGIPSEIKWIGGPAVDLNHDLIVLHRVEYDDYAQQIVAKARTMNKVLVFETDDLIFDPDVVRYFGYNASTERPESIELFRQTLLACDCCLASTEFIAQMARRHGKEAFVVRNAYSNEELELARAVHRHPVAGGGRIVLGYLSGTGVHNYDFAEVSDAILEVMRKHKKVYLQVAGPLSVPSEFATLGHRVRRLSLVPWQHIYQIIASLDINLAPLEIREPFCQGKSEIKYTEAALVGVPTIASATGSFQHAIMHGKTSLLAGDHAEWVAGLESLITNRSEIERLGNNAREHVLRDYSPSARSAELVATLGTIMQRYSKGAAPAGVSVVHRPDLGLPYSERPRRMTIAFLVTYFRRAFQYEGWAGFFRRLVKGLFCR